MTRVLKLSLLLSFAGSLLCAPAASAADRPRDEVCGLAAARTDAFMELTARVYGFHTRGGRTVAELLDRDKGLRDDLNAALRRARVFEGPIFEDSGLVRITIEFDTNTFTYNLRSKLPKMPRYIRADGVADKKAALAAATTPPGELPQDVLAWTQMSLDAEGEAAVKPANDPERAKQAARQQAMANAFTELVKKIGQLKLEPSVTVEEFLALHDDLRTNINAAAFGADLVSESVDREATTYKVKVLMMPETVVRVLKLGDFRLAQATTLNPIQMQLARADSLRDARETLRRKVFNFPLRNKLTLAEYAQKNEDAKNAIEMLCRRVPIDNVEVTDDGVVKTYVSIAVRDLPRDVRGLLAADEPENITTIGGGLPVAQPLPVDEKKPGKAPEAQPEGKE